MTVTTIPSSLPAPPSPSSKQEDTPTPSTIPPPTLPPLLRTLLPPHPKDAETFTHRKAEIMRKLSLPKIRALFEEETNKVLLMLEEDRRNNEEINKEIEKLEKQQELERRIYSKMPSRREKEEEEKKVGLGLGIGMGSGSGSGSEGRGGEEGEVMEDGEDVKMEGV